MISKKRLKELIEQKATIYCIVKEPFIAGYSNILKIVPIVLDNSYGISVEEYNNQNKCKPLFYQKGIIFHNICDADDIYETKEEAEFVLKFHTYKTKTFYFKPPTYKEFDKIHNEWKCNNINIFLFREGKCYVVEDQTLDNLDCFHYREFKYIDKKSEEEKYYEALEYMKKLFLEEE